MQCTHINTHTHSNESSQVNNNNNKKRERGEHNGDVYGGMLGLAPADLRQLAQDGVI